MSPGTGTFAVSSDGTVRCVSCGLHNDGCSCQPYRFLVDLLEHYEHIDTTAEDLFEHIADTADALRLIVHRLKMPVQERRES